MEITDGWAGINAHMVGGVVPVIIFSPAMIIQLFGDNMAVKNV